MTITEQWTHDGNDAGSYTSPLDKATLHSTEGASIEGAISSYEIHNSWPHKTVDYRKGHRRVCVHNPLDRAARALKNTAAAGETNRDGTLQYELVGQAEQILAQYDEQDWIDLGHDVLGPDLRACGIPLVCTVTMPTYPPPNGERLGHESTRLTRAAVAAIVGILGHCNWPENEHGDPGPLTAKHYRGGTISAIGLILEGAGAVPPHHHPDWSDMATRDEIKDALREVLEEPTRSGTPAGSIVNTLRSLRRAVIENPDVRAGDKPNAFQSIRASLLQVKDRLDNRS